MTVSRRILMAMGSITVVVLVIGLAAPKATHGIVATLVQVVNDTGHPVPVQVVNSPGRQGLLLNFNVDIANGQFNASGFLQDQNGNFVVPVGQRFVVDSISGIVEVPSGQKPLFVQFRTTVAGVNGTHIVVPVLVFPDPTRTDIYEFSTQFSTYADPGTQIGFSCGRTDTFASAPCFGTLSGHLESLQ